MQSVKTIDDVTIDEWAEFVVAARELLSMARFMVWYDAHENDDDKSFVEAIERMEGAFVMIGLDQGTLQGFIKQIGQTLKLPPDEFMRRLAKTKVILKRSTQ